MESSKAIPKKPFNCEEEINLTPQDRIGNISWCKCGYECKPMATVAEHFWCRDRNKIPDENFKGT